MFHLPFIFAVFFHISSPDTCASPTATQKSARSFFVAMLSTTRAVTGLSKQNNALKTLFEPLDIENKAITARAQLIQTVSLQVHSFNNSNCCGKRRRRMTRSNVTFCVSASLVQVPQALWWEIKSLKQIIYLIGAIVMHHIVN